MSNGIERIEKILEQQLALNRSMLRRIEHLERLFDEVAELRKHFGISDRGRCPKCKSPIHPAAKACKQCGASWEDAPTGTGLPR